MNPPLPGATSAASPSRRRAFQAALSALAWTVGSGVLAQPHGAPPAAPREAPRTGFYANFDGLKLVGQDGRALVKEQLLGHVVLINFVFTGCSTVCPVQTRALAELQRQLPASLRPRVRLLSISLDPSNDTPAALKAFAQRMGVDLTQWRFATGRPQDVERLSEALRLFRPAPDVRKPDDHSTALWMVDPQGHLRMRYAGNPPDVPRLLRELATVDELSRRPPA